MVPKFANVYKFVNRHTGQVMTVRWDVRDGGQTNYTGPSTDYDFVSLETNVPDGEQPDDQYRQMGVGIAALPSFATGRVLITPIH